MKIIVCLSDNKGMLFNNRRQSSDEEVITKILELTKGSKLWMNNYSSKLFPKLDNINISDNFINEAGENDYCFIENNEIPKEKITGIIIYYWNRNYPADTFFNFEIKKNCFKKICSMNFIGHSHKEITEEIYIKKELSK